MVGMVCAVVALPVSAQFSTVELGEATPVEATESASSVDPVQVQKITETYFQHVETYRLNEERFVIAQQDYYQQNTLASLEEAIRRARDLMRARADVIESYYTYLRLILQDTRGIEIEDKNIVGSELRFWQDQMVDYRSEVANLESRPAIQEHLTLFNSQEQAMLHSAYTALVLIKIGKIQTAIDNAVLVRATLANAIEASSISAADKAIKRRGLEEIDRLIQRARNNVIDLELDFRTKSSAGAYTRQTYQAFRSDAEFSYLQLRQVGEFMKETARGL